VETVSSSSNEKGRTAKVGPAADFSATGTVVVKGASVVTIRYTASSSFA
jgi:hypothetical protein